MSLIAYMYRGREGGINLFSCRGFRLSYEIIQTRSTNIYMLFGSTLMIFNATCAFAYPGEFIDYTRHWGE